MNEYIRRIRLSTRTQFAFKDNRQYIAKVHIPNLAYSNQHIDIEVPQGSRDHAIV